MWPINRWDEESKTIRNALVLKQHFTFSAFANHQSTKLVFSWVWWNIDADVIYSLLRFSEYFMWNSRLLYFDFGGWFCFAFIFKSSTVKLTHMYQRKNCFCFASIWVSVRVSNENVYVIYRSNKELTQHYTSISDFWC